MCRYFDNTSYKLYDIILKYVTIKEINLKRYLQERILDMRGKIEVEQVKSNGEIVFDYDTSISVTKIYERIKAYFPNICKDAEGIIVGKYNDKKYSIRAKNITYLGNPHPEFKKRIQISNDLQDFYNKSKSKRYYLSNIGDDVIYTRNIFLGCFLLNISFCFAVATCVYISVILIELCPSIS